MAIIVDKVQKRKNIALSCKNLILEENLKNITISKLTQQAKIAKGSFYDYFTNKEDLVFEIVSIFMQEYNEKLEKKLNKAKNTKKKLKIFSEFFYNDEDKELRKIYKEFIAIALSTPSDEMINFQSKCFDIYKKYLENIIQEAINKGELKKEAISFVELFFVTMKGFYITSETTKSIKNLKKSINDYIDLIYNLNKEK
jgi:AcrR family transcriptional regulator